MADQNENQDDNNNEGNNPQASGNNQAPQSAEAFNANPALYSYGNAPRQPAPGQYVPLPGVSTPSHQASPSSFPQQVTGGSQTTGPQQGTAQQAFAAPIAQRLAGGQTPDPAAGTPGQTSNQSSFPPNNTVVDPSATGRILRNEYGVAYIDSPYLPDGFKHYYTISQWGAPDIGSFALPPTVSQPQPWDPSMLKPEKKSPFLQFLSNTLGSTRATSGQPNANLVRFVFAEGDDEGENNDNSNNDNEAAESEPEDEQGNGGSQEDVLEGWQFRSVQQARLHRARQRQAAGHQVTNRVISQSLMDRQAEHVLSIHDAIRDVSSETGANQSGPRGRGSRAYRMLTSGEVTDGDIQAAAWLVWHHILRLHRSGSELIQGQDFPANNRNEDSDLDLTPEERLQRVCDLLKASKTSAIETLEGTDLSIAKIARAPVALLRLKGAYKRSNLKRKSVYAKGQKTLQSQGKGKAAAQTTAAQSEEEEDQSSSEEESASPPPTAAPQPAALPQPTTGPQPAAAPQPTTSSRRVLRSSARLAATQTTQQDSEDDDEDDDNDDNEEDDSDDGGYTAPPPRKRKRRG